MQKADLQFPRITIILGLLLLFRPQPIRVRKETRLSVRPAPKGRKPACLIPLLALFFCASALLPCRSAAHSLPDETLPDIGVNEKLNAEVPLDLSFTDQNGRPVRLREYFTGGPVILTLNYYSCPTLCPIVFRNLSNTVGAIKGLSLAKDYRIVTVSIDPDETTTRAAAKAQETWRMLPGLVDPANRWPFLTGNAAAIERLTGTLGVRYKQLEKNNFAHPSVIIVITPQGKVARYLYGIEQSPSDLKLALVEAANGRIGGLRLLNQALLYCFHYDPVAKSYAVTAINLMKLTGGAMLGMLTILLAVHWLKERHVAKGVPKQH